MPRTEQVAKLSRESLRPGPGWRRVSSAVYEHTSGLRAHAAGCCRLIGGRFVNGHRWPESRRLDLFIRAAGGNRRRGTMTWAKQMQRKEGQCHADD